MSADIGYIQVKISELNDKNEQLEKQIDELNRKISKIEESAKNTVINLEDIKTALYKITDLNQFKRDLINAYKQEMHEKMFPSINDYINTQIQTLFNKSDFKTAAEQIAKVNQENMNNTMEKFEKIQLIRYGQIIDAIKLINEKGNFGAEFQYRKIKL